MSNKTTILIVDDSAVVRQSLVEVFAEDDELEVIGTAHDPFMAAQKLKKRAPDVITLDIEMPKMDGITFLKKLMQQHPLPVVVLSTLTEKGTAVALKALNCGAVEVLAKPKFNTKEELLSSANLLREAVKTASKANLKNIGVARKKSVKEILKSRLIPKPRSTQKSNRVLAIGASTGGTEAIKAVLSDMTMDSPGVLIVQHMPEVFTAQFAARLNDECGINVKEAQDGDEVLNGRALIAPGNMHMMLKGNARGYYVEVKTGPLVNRHMPSVDVLFKSVARYAGGYSVGALLTGMGADGAKGLLEMKEAGAATVAQSEDTCVVYGMPKEAVKIGAAERIVALNRIAAAMLKLIK